MVNGLSRTTFQTEILMMAHTEKGKLEHLQKYKEKGVLNTQKYGSCQDDINRKSQAKGSQNW